MPSGTIEEFSIELYQGAARPSIVFTCLNQDDEPINLENEVVVFHLWSLSGESIAALSTNDIDTDISIGGIHSNVVTIGDISELTMIPGSFKCELRRTGSAELVIGRGAVVVRSSVSVPEPEDS